MKLLTLILFSLLEVIPAGKAVLQPLQKRDSILIADHVSYGVLLDGIGPADGLALPDLSSAKDNDTLVLVRGWQLDTLTADRPATRKEKERILKDGTPATVFASIILAPFEEGEYVLPDITVLHVTGEGSDTLLFEGLEMDVRTIPVDTVTFVPHDIKGQIRYPVTVAEILPWAGLGIGSIALVAAIVLLVRRLVRRRRGEDAAHRDPAYIVALRELDKYRSDKYWAPEKQKLFYSGITDALKFYMDDRFGVDAPEMTTAELFDALKGEKDIPEDMYAEMKDLFERADFVKFAKFTAPDEDNARALPAAVRFVTSTYQVQLEQDQAEGGAE